MRKLPIPVLSAALLSILAACGGGDGNAAQASSAADAQSAANGDYAADENIWRMQRTEKLTKPDGWTALVGLHWLELKSHYIGSGSTSGIRLAKGPERMGLIQRNGERVFFTPERGVALTLDGEPLKGRVELHDDRSEIPSVVGFDEGKGAMTLIWRSGRHALRVKHADAETRTKFAGLEYWPADPSWKIDAKFIPSPAGKTIPIATIIGTTENMPNPGALEFERDGKTYRIEALDEGDEDWLLIIADRTSGHDSYGAGRYIDVAMPDANGRVTIDFNHAHNPPCAFTPFATCPLPPPENRLDLAITAGEKRYGQAH